MSKRASRFRYIIQKKDRLWNRVKHWPTLTLLAAQDYMRPAGASRNASHLCHCSLISAPTLTSLHCVLQAMAVAIVHYLLSIFLTLPAIWNVINVY